MAGNRFMRQQQFPGVKRLSQHFLIGNQVMDSGVAQMAEVQSSGSHLGESEAAHESRESMDPSGNEMMERQPRPASTQFATTRFRMWPMAWFLVHHTIPEDHEPQPVIPPIRNVY